MAGRQGFELGGRISSKLVMARVFWLKRFAHRRLRRSVSFTAVHSSTRDSPPVVETFWRRSTGNPERAVGTVDGAVVPDLSRYNGGMTSRAQDILREALALPLDERAGVAAELLASLDDAAMEHPADVQSAWAAEIERRARRALADESGGVAWDDVRRRAEAELRRQ